MFDNERVVWVYMCLGGMSWDACVGLLHLQNTQDSHSIHLLLCRRSEATDYISQSTKTDSLQPQIGEGATAHL